MLWHKCMKFIKKTFLIDININIYQLLLTRGNMFAFMLHAVMLVHYDNTIDIRRLCLGMR
jgi:hypothetical protein